MKRTISLISLLLVCLCAHAQDCFSVQDGHVIWQEVYQSDMDSLAVAAALITNGKVSNFVGIPGGLTCKIDPHYVDYEGAGFLRRQVATLLLGCPMEARAVIEFREGRYRVTVSEITFLPGAVTYLGVSHIEDFTTRDGDFNRSFYSTHADAVIDYDINSIFELQPAEDEEW